MDRSPWRAGALLCSLLVMFLCTQCNSRWRDPSPHVTQFVTVDEDVRLEVLDWGGSGRPVVLLAGGGNTAHVFDDFAPKLMSNYHVVGIARRGFGASGYRGDDNTADRLGDDVLAVIDSLRLDRPILVGHSFGGLEMSSIASRYPTRVAGLIYLDAGYSYAFDNGKGADAMEMMKLSAPQTPPAGASDLASFEAFRTYYKRMNGFSVPEAELRTQRKAGRFGRVGGQLDPPGGSMLMAVLSSGKKYTQIPAPAFFIYANPHSLGPWVDRSTDPRVRAEAKSYSAVIGALTEKQIKSVRDGVPAAQMIEIPFAHHYVYMTNEDLVLSSMRTFITELH